MNYVATLTFVSRLPWSECHRDLDADVDNKSRNQAVFF